MRVPLRALAIPLIVAACGDPTDPPPAVTLATGSFALERIDHAVIPQRIARSGGDSSDVIGGTLTLNSTTSRLNFSLYATRSDGHDVVESYSTPLRVIAPDSFAALYWRGRAWGDTAEMLTTGAQFGTHLLRFVRVPDP